MIHARPNLNGNSVADFKEHTDDLDRYVCYLSDTLCSIRAGLFHGRNYQTVDNPVDSRQADLNKVDMLIGLLHEYEDFIYEMEEVTADVD